MTPSDIEIHRKSFEDHIGYKPIFEDGIYKYDFVTNERFYDWISARESLCVTIPKPDCCDSIYEHGFTDAILKFKVALQSAGINYRERE